MHGGNLTKQKCVKLSENTREGACVCVCVCVCRKDEPHTEKENGVCARVCACGLSELIALSQTSKHPETISTLILEPVVEMFFLSESCQHFLFDPVVHQQHTHTCARTHVRTHSYQRLN